MALLTLNIINAQNWKPIHPTEKYNYALNNDSIILVTILVDSIDIVENDSVYFLNKTIKPCPTCVDPCFSDLGFPVYLLNQSQYFLSDFRQTGNTSVFSGNNKQYILEVGAGLNESWIFDSTNNISAQIISLDTKSIFGITDSVKTIELSSNDTVIISKNHGIIQFPVFDSIHQKIKLVGIEGQGQGTLTPKYEDIFNFSIGDAFEYSRYGHGQNYYNSTIKKYIILDKIVSGDSIKYIIDLKEKITTYIYNQGGTTYIDQIDSLLYIRNSGSFLDKFASQQHLFYFGYWPQYKVIEIGHDSAYTCRTKYYINNQLRPCRQDTLWDGVQPPSQDYRQSETYGEFRGLIKLHFYSFDYSSYHDLTVDEDLVAFSVGNVQYGVFSPDSIFVGINEVNSYQANFNVYPNPATKTITIEIPKLKKECTLMICNMIGQELIRQQITENKKQLDISKLKCGVYFFKLLNDKSIEVRKVIIQ